MDATIARWIATGAAMGIDESPAESRLDRLEIAAAEHRLVFA